jgi:hypothetical protein
MYVDAVTPVLPHEPYYDRQFPFDAVQVQALRHYPPPPFELSKSFRVAFAHAVKKYGVQRLTTLRQLQPPTALLDGVVAALDGDS